MKTGARCMALMGLFILVVNNTWAQGTEEETPPKYWTHKVSLGANFTNVTLNNWAGGGQNSISISGVFGAQLQYKKDKATWLNSLDIGYGRVRQEGIEEFRKSDDRFVFTSKFSRGVGAKKFTYSALLDFRTQMDAGLKYFETDAGDDSSSIISRFMAPAYLNLGLGMGYKPSDDFYVMVSPLSGKLTFVLDETLAAAGAFGVEPGEQLNPEVGASLNLRWYWAPLKNAESKLGNAFKNVSYETKLNLFQAYERGTAMDMIWDNTIEIKANDYITTTFSAQLIYDEDVDLERNDGTIGPAVQSKYVLAVGFLYKI